MTPIEQVAATGWKPPSTPDELQAWLDSEIEAIAADMDRVLNELLAPVLEQYAASVVQVGVVASGYGDGGTLDGIHQAWQAYTVTDLGPRFASLMTQGALTAYVGAEGAQHIPESVATGWTAVVNEAAVNYSTTVSNRLVGVGDAMFRVIRDDVTEAVASGATNEQLKATIQGHLNSTEFRADTIARTEAQKAYNGGDHEGADALGDYAPVAHGWLATGDARTREEHAVADGQVVAFDEPFEVGGEQLMYPLDDAGSDWNVINCRCVELHYYPGDPEAEPFLPAAPPPPDQWEPEPLDIAGDLELTQTPMGLGGAHEKYVFRDADGKRFLFKPMDEHLARGEVAGNEVARRAGLDMPRINVHTTAEGRVGTLQEMVPNARNAFPGSPHNFDPLLANPQDLQVMEQHRVVDWAISNHDSHAGQFIRQGYADQGGQIMGIDKGQAFKYFDSDKLNWHYAPNKAFGEADPVYNKIEQAYRENKLDGRLFQRATNPNDVRRTAEAIRDIPDAEYRAMWRGYAEGVTKSADEAEALLDRMVARKNDVVGDFEKYHRKLYNDRLKVRKAEGLVEQPPLSTKGIEGAPKGMTGAPVSKADVQFMKEYDNPALDTEGANAALKTYTGGSFSSINGAARSGGELTPTGKRIQKAMTPVKKDMIVRRGTTLRPGSTIPSTPSELVGHVFHDRAFLSTSAGDMRPAFGGNTLLEIRVNEGFNGRYVAPISNYGNAEREFLLDADQHLYVHAIRAADKASEIERNYEWVYEVETVTKEWATTSTSKVWDSNLGKWIGEDATKVGGKVAPKLASTAKATEAGAQAAEKAAQTALNTALKPKVTPEYTWDQASQAIANGFKLPNTYILVDDTGNAIDLVGGDAFTPTDIGKMLKVNKKPPTPYMLVDEGGAGTGIMTDAGFKPFKV